MYCPKCGNLNDDSSKFCSGCGSALSQADKAESHLHAEINTPPNSVQAESDEPHNSDEFYKAIVGPKNQDYYLSQFSRFDSNGKVNASWHWSAFFVTFYWFLYRKMWLNALIYFLLPYFVMILLGIVGAATGKSSDIVVGIGSVLFLIVAFVLPPMYANALYYKHCKKKIAEASLSSQDTQRRLGELSAKGGTSKVVIILVLIFASITFIGILAAVAIPAYQDYTKKVRMAKVPDVVVLPYEEAVKVTGNAGLQFDSLFMGSLYNGSNYDLRHVTVEITAKEKNGKVRWQRRFVDDIFIKPLTTGKMQIEVVGAAGADIEWGIVEIKGVAP